MNTPQTRFITLAAMKVTNTDHTAIWLSLEMSDEPVFG